MKRTLIASALVAAFAAPAFANSQLEQIIGVEPGVFTSAELAAIKGSFDTDTGYNIPARDGVVTSSQSVAGNAGAAQLAAQLGVNPADYTVAELAAIKGSFDSDMGYNIPVRGGVVSSQSVGISAAHAQLAAAEGVNPADYTLGEVLSLKAQRENAEE